MSSVIIFILDLKFLFIICLGRVLYSTFVYVTNQEVYVKTRLQQCHRHLTHGTCLLQILFWKDSHVQHFFTLSITKNQFFKSPNILWDSNYYIYDLYPKKSFKPCQFYQILLLITKVWNIYNNSVTYIHQCGRWTIGWLSIYYISLGNHV